jgi:hypothetical protein
MLAQPHRDVVRDDQPAVPGAFWRGLLVGLPLSSALWGGLILLIRLALGG